MDLPGSDWGDFSCRRAVDSSSLLIILCVPVVHWDLELDSKLLDGDDKDYEEVVEKMTEEATRARCQFLLECSDWFYLWRLIDVFMHTKLMAECKTVVTPLMMFWSYCSLVISHQNDTCICSQLQKIPSVHCENIVVLSWCVLNSLRPSDAYMRQQTNHHWSR